MAKLGFYLVTVIQINMYLKKYLKKQLSTLENILESYISFNTLISLNMAA